MLFSFPKIPDFSDISYENIFHVLRPFGYSGLPVPFGRPQWHYPGGLQKSYKYQCEEASLEDVSKILFNNPKYMDRLNALYAENYSRIHSKNTVTIVTGFEIGKRVFNSIMHADYRGLVTEAKGIFGIVGAVKNNRLFIKAIDELSFNEICALAAIRLTVLQACGEKMSKESYKEAIDDYLTYVNNVRADAEYKLFAEGMDAPNCKETIETCNACLARLGQIVGI